MHRLLIFHEFRRIFGLILLLFFFIATIFGKEKQWSLRVIDTPVHVIKSIIQDSIGLIWLGTDGGLYRYDGSTFSGYYPVKDQKLEFNRIDRIYELPNHNILCRQRDALIIFDRKTKAFVNLPEDYIIPEDIWNRPLEMPLSDKSLKEILFSVGSPVAERIYMHIYDRDGNLWVATNRGLWLISPVTNLFQNKVCKSEVVSFFKDNEERLWIVFADGSIHLYDVSMNFLGYLSAEGGISKNEVIFPYSVRTIKQDRHGNIWIAALNDGLLRLQPQGRQYKITQYKMDNIQPSASEKNKVIDIYIDEKERIWIGNLYGSLTIAEEDAAGIYRFTRIQSFLKHGQGKVPQQIRGFLELEQNALLIYTENGIYTCGLGFDDYSDLRFYHQTHNPADSTSLPQNLVLGAAQSKNGHIIVACRQLYEIADKDVLSDTLHFVRIDAPQLSNDVLALCTDNDGLVWGCTERAMLCVEPEKRRLDLYPHVVASETGTHLSYYPFFSFNDSCMLKGCLEGWIQFDPHKVTKRSNIPAIYFTEIRVMKNNLFLNADLDTLCILQPDERDFIVHFSVLDYNQTAPVWYAYRIEGVESNWTYTDQGKTMPYANLSAGNYVLSVRSTNGDGAWVENERRLYIRILPYWYECVWGQCAIVFTFLFLIIGMGWLVHLYIRRKVSQMVLEKVQALEEEIKGNQMSETKDQDLPMPEIVDEDKLFRQKLYDYLNSHIADSEFKVEDLAQHMGMSRTVFTGKIKSFFNCTPIDLIVATRITRALQYMQQDISMTISEIAYNSGFNDPRYFSRCFKKHVGKSPSDYISEKELLR